MTDTTVKKKNSNITFIIGTFNEEKRISYPIRAFLPYGQVLIVDNFSQDKTVKIAKDLGARVIKYKNKGWTDSRKQLDFIFSQVDTDWVFLGSADELVPRTCLKKYCEIADQNKYKIVFQKRKTLMYDSESEFFPSYNYMTFFRKDAIDLTDNEIHQRGKFTSHVKPAEILYLPPLDEYSIYHFSIFTAETQLKNLSSYALIQAASVDKKITYLNIASDCFFIFLYVFLFQRAIFRGIKGFIASIQAMYYSFLIKAKAYELQNDINFDAVERRFVNAKKKILTKSPRSNIFQKLLAYLLVIPVKILHKRYKFAQIAKS